MKRKIFLIIILIIFSGCKPTSSLGRLRIISADLKETHNLIAFNHDLRVLFVQNYEHSGYIAIVGDKARDDYALFAEKVLFFDVSLSQDDRQVLFCFTRQGDRNSSSLGVYDLNDGALKLIDIGEGIYSTPSFAPQGDKVAFSFSSNGLTSRLYVYCLRTDLHEELTQEDFFDRTPIFVGEDVLFFWRATKFAGYSAPARWRDWNLYQLTEKGEISILTDTVSSVPQFAVAPDNNFAVFVDSYVGGVSTVDVDTLEVTTSIKFEMCADARYLGPPHFWSLAPSGYDTQQAFIISPSMSDRYERNIVYGRMTGGKLTKVLDSTKPFKSLCFSSDRKSIFYTLYFEHNVVYQESLQDGDTETRKYEAEKIFNKMEILGEHGDRPRISAKQSREPQAGDGPAE